MQQAQTQIQLSTRGPGLVEFTHELDQWCRQTGIETGLLTLFVRHTSASLTIQENADPDVQHDLKNAMDRLAPRDMRLYRHTMEGPDDMPAHIRSALTDVSLSIPVAGGRPTLGTWQGVYLFEHRDRPHQRSVIVHLIGE